MSALHVLHDLDREIECDTRSMANSGGKWQEREARQIYGIEPWRCLAGIVKSFKEIEEHWFVNTSVLQLRCVGPDKSSRAILGPSLW